MDKQTIERLCKRHMAKLLTGLRESESGLQLDHEKYILKQFSFLMADLKLSNTKEKQDDNWVHNNS